MDNGPMETGIASTSKRKIIIGHQIQDVELSPKPGNGTAVAKNH